MKITSLFRLLHRQTLGALVAAGLLFASLAAPAARAGSVNAAHPGYGGTASYATLPAPGCIDPNNITSDLIATTQIGDTVVTQNDRARLRPDLALSWRYSHGGRSITFSLRHGVRFSNGDPFGASDVKYTLDRIRNPAAHSPFMYALNTVQDVKVVSRYTVRIDLTTPFRPLLTFLANPFFTVVDRKAVDQEGDKFCLSPVSTGAFMVKSVGPGFSSVTLTRNPYHTWEPGNANNKGRAYLSSFVMKYIQNPAAAASELINGDVDITAVAGDQLDRVRHNPSIKLHRVLRYGVYYLAFNTSHPPFDKLAVRKAIAEAIDRKAGIKVSLGGLGVPAYSPIPQVLPFYDKQSRSYAIQYNPKDARRILAANHVTGPFVLFTAPIPSSQAAAEFIQAELLQVGVQTKIVTGGPATEDKGQFDLDMTRAGMSDPDQLYTLFHSSQTPDKGGPNITYYRSASLDKLLVKGRETVNMKKAREIYAEAQRELVTHVVIDPLWTDVTMMGVRSRVHGWHTGLLGFNPLAQDLYVKG